MWALGQQPSENESQLGMCSKLTRWRCAVPRSPQIRPRPIAFKKPLAWVPQVCPEAETQLLLNRLRVKTNLYSALVFCPEELANGMFVRNEISEVAMIPLSMCLEAMTVS